MSRALHAPVGTLTAVALAALLASAPAQAQIAPDAGQTLQDLKRAPEPSRQAPLPEVERPAASPILPGGMTVEVRRLAFSGNEAIDSTELAKLLDDALGHPLDMAGLRELTERVGAAYRARGYLFARAYLPPQDLKDGSLKIAVMEGRYGAVRAIADRDSLAAQAQAFLAPLTPGAIIEAGPLERATLLLGDQPGIAITPIVKPGAAVGTGDLDVEVQRTPAVTGSIGLDNEGNRYSGRNRLQASLDWAGPLRLGDQLSLRTLLSNEHLWLGSLDYNAPLGARGLRLDVNYAQTHYELGGAFASADASGYAKVGTLGLSYPLLRSNAANLKLSANVQLKRLRDDRVGDSERKSSRSLPLALDFDTRDNWLGGGVNYGNATATAGYLDAPDSTSLPGASGSSGSFTKLNLDVSRLQSVASTTSLYGRFSAQWANRNLDSSERISLGGISGVRAYPNGEAIGDRGWLLRLEARQAIGAFEPYAFIDEAHVQVDADPAASGSGSNSANTRGLGGAGLGLRWQRAHWSADVAVAWRTHGGPSQADPSASSHQVLASAQYAF